MTELQEIKKDLKEIKRLLAQRPVSASWVSAKRIIETTGWNKERLRQARNHGTIVCKPTTRGGYLYLLESVPEKYILK